MRPRRAATSPRGKSRRPSRASYARRSARCGEFAPEEIARAVPAEKCPRVLDLIPLSSGWNSSGRGFGGVRRIHIAFMRLDDFLPEFDVRTRHAIRVSAPSDYVYARLWNTDFDHWGAYTSALFA